ncbi:DNA translocase FtsK [Laribacter hongkongensis]|uniref:DNA translocase FtsK n=1 Tax=Laribacter hongkongensis TaxID=168471 RepID=UPI001EFE7F13|nr:DNA translocase FtsK [Laribacter hongkongensis]MCG9082589.1 DNA translocase FtsK 4TM domain-containing protein [Laribacter hongkongensis]
MRLFKRKPVVKNSSTPLPPRLANLLQEAWWLVMVAAAVYFVLILASYSPADPSWSHSIGGHPAIGNWGGTLGAYLSDMLLYLFGLSAWWLVVFCGAIVLWGYRNIRRVSPALDKVTAIASTGFVMILVASSGFEAIRFYSLDINLPLAPGGLLGRFVGLGLQQFIGFAGATMLLLLVWAIGISLFTGLSWLDLMEKIGTRIEEGLLWAKNSWEAREDRKIGRQQARERDASVKEEKRKQDDKPPVRIEPPLLEIPLSPKVAKQEEKRREPQQHTLFEPAPKPVACASNTAAEAELPTLSLLTAPPASQEGVSADTIEYTSRLIERKLADFGVEVKVIAAYPGPVITRYEIEPAVGVKGAQIVNLMKDLARALGLVSIRVVETIPGKTYMGLELPNAKRQIVRLSEIIGADTYQNAASKLTVVLGKDIAGKPVVADLAKMPHVLVAGTTGSGKSVAINAMILSLLYRATPEEVRLIMVDPKMLEMSVYEDIPHLLAPVVTDMKQAANALNWCVAEMEKRYRLMSKLGVRNLAGYNQKIRDAAKKGEKLPNPFSLTPDAPEPLDTLPVIVVLIDELADLMMVAGKKIEELIARLAQKARAAGIHLILATQRPSVDVITGLIKANIPTRIAFQVSSKVDSRTILDQMGAETLLGQGDMLYLPPGSGYPLRAHGAFVADDEVHRVVEYLKTTGEPDYVEGILTGEAASETAQSVGGDIPGFGSGEGGSEDSESDPLYDQAVAIVIKTRKASISSVQRHLRIGYNRAARLIEQMETAGLVSPAEHNGNRSVLVPAQPD